MKREAEKVKKLIVALARKIAVSTREGFAFAVSVESLGLCLHDVRLAVDRYVHGVRPSHGNASRMAHVADLVVGRDTWVVSESCIELQEFVVHHSPAGVDARTCIHWYGRHAHHVDGVGHRLRARTDVLHYTWGECLLVQTVELCDVCCMVHIRCLLVVLLQLLALVVSGRHTHFLMATVG